MTSIQKLSLKRSEEFLIYRGLSLSPFHYEWVLGKFSTEMRTCTALHQEPSPQQRRGRLEHEKHQSFKPRYLSARNN